MKLKNKSIALVDHLQERDSENSFIRDATYGEVAILDPIRLLSQSDWRRFEDDVDVINRIYSHLFDEVVIAKKKLICFWPLSEQYGTDWFELSALCSINDCELEVYKSLFFDGDGYGFSEEILRAWKRFVYFLVESLLDDIRLNEDLEEVATLNLGSNSIVLFKLGNREQLRYTYAVCSSVDKNGREQEAGPISGENLLPEFDSFESMLKKLLEERDLSSYQSKFIEPHLEKVYYNVVSKKMEEKNLIISWLISYSLN